VRFEAVVRDAETHKPVEGIQLWSWQHKGVEGTSDSDGLLKIDGMTPGEFEFQVTAVGEDRFQSCTAGDFARWWSSTAIHEHQRKEVKSDHFPRNFDSLAFDLQDGVFRTEIFVERLVAITGRVFDPNGKPVAGATVAPAKTGSGNSITGDTRYSYPTDREGRFTMKLPASQHAKYNMIAHDGKYEEWRNWANGVSETFQTKPGQIISNLDIHLTRPATVSGRVVDVLKRPRANVAVRAVAVDCRDHRYYLPTTKTDEQGNYQLQYIHPGEHVIQVGPLWSPAQDVPNEITKNVMVEAEEVIMDVDFIAN